MVQNYDPDNDNDTDVEGQPDTDGSTSPFWFNPYISLVHLPTEHGHVAHVRVGSMHLGSVVSHGKHHVAVGYDGAVSEHSSHADGVNTLARNYGFGV